MKKTIVLLIIVVLSVPCLAQEPVSPSGLFSIDDTLWEITDSEKYYLGLRDNAVWLCDIRGGLCRKLPDSFIIDLGVIAFYLGSNSNGTVSGLASSILGVAPPLG